jgi:hypothetical protein
VRKAEQEGSLSCRSVYRQAITSAGAKWSVSQLSQQKRSFIQTDGLGTAEKKGTGRRSAQALVRWQPLTQSAGSLSSRRSHHRRHQNPSSQARSRAATSASPRALGGTRRRASVVLDSKIARATDQVRVSQRYWSTRYVVQWGLGSAGSGVIERTGMKAAGAVPCISFGAFHFEQQRPRPPLRTEAGLLGSPEGSAKTTARCASMRARCLRSSRAWEIKPHSGRRKPVAVGSVRPSVSLPQAVLNAVAATSGPTRIVARMRKTSFSVAKCAKSASGITSNPALPPMLIFEPTGKMCVPPVS